MATSCRDSTTGAPKNRLFCPACEHASPTTGDWVLLVHDCSERSWLAYQCPECETVVTRRPLPDEAGP